MGMENYEIPDSGLDATSGYASRLRLFINVHGGWYGGRESNHYVEITMGYVPKVCKQPLSASVSAFVSASASVCCDRYNHYV